MSRVANSPVALPKGVDIKVEGLSLSVKGGKGTLDLTLTDGVGVNVEEDVATITYEGDSHRAMAGTTRSLLANMVKGVSEGWEKKLVLNGVGYRAKASGKTVNLTIGLVPPGGLPAGRGLVSRYAQPDRNCDLRDRQAGRWSGCRGNPQLPTPGALQRKRHSLRRRVRPA